MATRTKTIDRATSQNGAFPTAERTGITIGVQGGKNEARRTRRISGFSIARTAMKNPGSTRTLGRNATLPRSSWRETVAPSVANMKAYKVYPSKNQKMTPPIISAPRLGSDTFGISMIEITTVTVAASTSSCARPSAPMPSTLATRTWSGLSRDSTTSTTRFCFSSTVPIATNWPKTRIDM